VPTERDVATTKVEIALPEAQPLASVSTKPVAGWTATVTKRKLATPAKDADGAEITEAATRIVWAADSADTAIKAGEFQEFEISVGPLPSNAEKMVFKALQTYSDGEVVRWIDEAKDAEHPAPTLTLTKATGDDHHGDASAVANSEHVDAHHSDEHDESPDWPGWLGLVAGVAGLGLAGLALARTRTTRAN
jgi:uncharacterized protein YcnI